MVMIMIPNFVCNTFGAAEREEHESVRVSRESGAGCTVRL